MPLIDRLVFSPSKIEFLKKAREEAELNGKDFGQRVPPMLEMALEAVVKNCCFFFKTLHCTQLKHLPNNLIQRILDKIFATREFCVKHRDCMVMSLLGPNVTEFNHLLLWESKYDERGFDNLAFLCFKCPNLKKLKTIECQQYVPDVQPHLMNFIGDLCVLKKLTSLVLPAEITCPSKDMRLIQENLTKLEHLEVTIVTLEKDTVEAFAGMLNLKVFHLLVKFDSSRRAGSDEYIEALVMCAGRIKNLQTFFTRIDDNTLFIEKYAAQFPQKHLRLNSVEIKGSLKIPWPKFLTCDQLLVTSPLYHITSEFDGVSFPLKRCMLQHRKIDEIYRLLDNAGQNIERLCIKDVRSERRSRVAEKLCLNEVMSRCPKVVHLEFENCPNLTAFFDENASGGCMPLRQEHFSNLRRLSISNPCNYTKRNAVTAEKIDLYKNIFCKAKEISFLNVDSVLLAKAGLTALAEDKDCFKKVKHLNVATYGNKEVRGCEYVFLFVKHVIERSMVLDEVSVHSEYFGNDDEEDYDQHGHSMQSLSNKIQPYAIALGIDYYYDDM